MLEGVQRMGQSYIDALPLKENINWYQTAGISFFALAYLAQLHNSYQTAAIGTAAYGAAIAVQFLVSPLFKQFADTDDTLGPIEQSIKDFTYQVTIVSITCGVAAINPVWFGTAILANLFWNAFIEDSCSYQRIRNVFPLVTLMQVGLI